MGTLRRSDLMALAFAFAVVFSIAGLGRSPGVAREQESTPAASPVAGAASFRITGLVETPLTLTVADLQKLPAQTVDVSFGSKKGTEKHAYTGVGLAAVIDQAKLKLDPARKNDALRKYLVVTANDGYEVVISWGEIDPAFGNSPYLLAWQEDGKPLGGDRGPVRLVTPGDVKGGRYVTGVATIEVRDVDSPPRA